MNQTVLQEKQSIVSEIKDKLVNAASAVVVEYRGLTVDEVTQLRRNLRAEGVDFKVYKNKMAQRASVDAGYEGLVEYLTGPNALAFSDDAVAPSRILAEFAKKHEALKLKGGVVEGNIVGEDKLDELAKLPNREGMLSMLAGMLKSPIRSFAYAVSQIAESKEEAN